MAKPEVEVLTIDGREVRVTNPNKPYFSLQTKLSKLDLVRYYLSVAPGALAGIRDRPLFSSALSTAPKPRRFIKSERPNSVPSGCEPLRCLSPRVVRLKKS